jgi:hypothetical protein
MDKETLDIEHKFGPRKIRLEAVLNHFHSIVSSFDYTLLLFLLVATKPKGANHRTQTQPFKELVNA